MKKIVGCIVASSAIFFVCACSSSSSSSGTTSGGDGGGGGNGATCTATASGGTTGAQPCGVGAAGQNNDTTFQIVSSADVAPDGVSIIIEFAGPPALQTYTSATVINSLGDFKSIDKTSEWENQSNGGTDSEGSFSLTITDVGTATSGSVIGYSNMHGTYTGTFIPKPGGPGGTGTSTLNITF